MNNYLDTFIKLELDKRAKSQAVEDAIRKGALYREIPPTEEFIDSDIARLTEEIKSLEVQHQESMEWYRKVKPTCFDEGYFTSQIRLCKWKIKRWEEEKAKRIADAEIKHITTIDPDLHITLDEAMLFSIIDECETKVIEMIYGDPLYRLMKSQFPIDQLIKAVGDRLSNRPDYLAEALDDYDESIQRAAARLEQIEEQDKKIHEFWYAEAMKRFEIPENSKDQALSFL